MARNLDVSALRSFVAVADCGGVTRAAQRLNLTQSAVSMQIKRLETALGVDLLAREGRGVGLTARGDTLLGDARRLIAVNDEILERMVAAQPEGLLTLGMPHDVVYPMATEVMRRFAADFPRVRVNLISLMSAELLQKLDSGECDVIVTTELGVRPDGEALSRRPLVWAGAPEGRAWRRTPPPIAVARRCAFRKPTFEALEEAGLGWDWTISTANDDALYAAVAADLAICSLLEGTVPRALVEVEHHGALPELPVMSINLYQGEAGDAALTAKLAAYTRDAHDAWLRGTH